MRKKALEMIYELAKKDKRVFFIGSDLGHGTMDQFKKEMPERFLMEGISEQNIVGMAAGLALEGKIVYINTIATFLTRRCFEQIVLDLCLHNTNVRLIASGGGYVYAQLGPTHQAIDDIGILRSIPNITIIAPADADEMKRAMTETLHHIGPVYIRVAKGGEPIVTKSLFQIGKAFPYREGRDALVITTGITLKIGLDAAEKLATQGIQVSVVHMPTIKPFDSETIKRYAKEIPIITTIEEHNIIGGLGSAVAETLAEANFVAPKKFKRIGINDLFAEGYGSQAALLEKYGITISSLVSTITMLHRQSGGV
jgi:transketolase